MFRGRYLVEHSAGSGKSNTIAWLAHRLSTLFGDESQPVFHKVIVITDRVVLDRQLQRTIFQFDHTPGAVKKIDVDSAQLAGALEDATSRIIISTLQPGLEERGDVVDGAGAVQPPGLARPPGYFAPDEIKDLFTVLGEQHVEVEEQFGQVGVSAVSDVEGLGELPAGPVGDERGGDRDGPVPGRGAPAVTLVRSGRRTSEPTGLPGTGVGTHVS